ncbi:MAG: YkgJ family cysteine cluster protein [Planctomycetia bacterium]|jgi:Fe-S-cluster containining protein
MVNSPRRRQKYPRTKPPRTKPCREDLAKDDCLCFHCPAKCCCYFALPIEEPVDWEDFEFIRWYLLHERATVFVDDGEWYLLVHNRCKALRDDNLCGDYENRPQICRDYTDDKCEYEDDWVYDQYFETSDQIYEYAEATLGPKEGKDIRSPRPK